MTLIKKKTFWYATISALVFITDIGVYFYLKDNAIAAPSAIIKKQDRAEEPLSLTPHISEEVQDNPRAQK